MPSVEDLHRALDGVAEAHQDAAKQLAVEHEQVHQERAARLAASAYAPAAAEIPAAQSEPKPSTPAT